MKHGGKNPKVSTAVTKVKDFMSIANTSDSLEELIDDYKTGRAYDSSIFNRQNHKNLMMLKDVPGMIDDPVIESCLAVIMESAFQTTDDQNCYWVQSKHDVITKELAAFHDRIGMDLTVLTIAYNLLLWGNFPFEHKFNSDGQLDLVIPRPDFTKITPITVSNQNVGYMVGDSYKYPYEFTYAQLQHFKDHGGNLQNSFYTLSGADGETPVQNEFLYSPSYLSTSSRPWKNINIIEDALILSRMDQSNYYRVISVDVGDKVYSKNAIKVLNYYRNIFKKVRRVSYDSNGMSSKGIGHEFEVVVPKSSRQDVDFHDVGGKIEVRAVKDLEIQYQKLFASLRVHPSMIGFSEDVPSSLGDSPAVLWDKRFARTVKALVFSTFNAVKNIDYYYLRSRGFNVTKNDWSYKTSAVSILEDKERKELLEQAVENTQSVMDLMKGADMEYNKKYLIRSMLGPALSSAAVDIDEFLKDETKTAIKSGASLIHTDVSNAVSIMQAVGMVTDTEKKQIISSLKGAEHSKFNMPASVIQSSGKASFAYIKSASTIFPDDALIELTSSEVKRSVKKGQPTIEADQMVSLPLRLPVNFIVDSEDEAIDITVGEIMGGSISPLGTVLLDETGNIYLRTKEDLITYLYMNMSGYKEVVAKYVRLPEREKSDEC